MGGAVLDEDDEEGGGEQASSHRAPRPAAVEPHRRPLLRFFVSVAQRLVLRAFCTVEGNFLAVKPLKDSKSESLAVPKGRVCMRMAYCLRIRAFARALAFASRPRAAPPPPTPPRLQGFV